MTADGHPERIGPYRIEERLGAGGMGTVYRAYDERLRRHVALKQIHPERAGRPEARERFLREARAVARLNHPALVHLHDILETDGGDWIVLELIEGPSVARLLEAGPLDPQQTLALGREVASGLAAAHAAGILHRDLKAENVVLTQGGRAKLLDFGLAAHVEATDDETVDDETVDDETRATLTGDGQIVGTPRAMSPEQVRGHEVDHRSDLFSLGVLLYEMTTGRSPFLGPGPAETLARVCHEEPDPVCEHAPDVPRGLSELIDRLLRKEPEERPASADEVALALARLVREARDEEPTPVPEVAVPAAPAAAAESDREPFQLRGERRQLTLLCCELTGASLDPETLFEVLPPFQAIVNEAIERYEGNLRDVQGHRFVALFGYPRAHEDNARRAVLTALQVVERTESVVQGWKARAGVHTGPAVILHRETGEHLALGETLDLATLLQERAAPGSVLVSGLTRRLVAGFFEEKVEAGEGGEAFRTVAARGVHDRVEANGELVPFVGRQRELVLLGGRFELAREGVGQAVLLVGEAGVGKSRLLGELRQRLRKDDPLWVSGYGSPYARNLPFRPVGGLLRRLLEIDGTVPAEEQLARLEKSLGEHDFPAAETMPLFATLLGLPGGGRPDLSRLRRETLEAVPALLQEAAESRPLVIAFEDLHHTDSMTLELIGRLIDDAPVSAWLLLLTCRPGFRAPWGQRAHLSQIRLGRLADSETLELIDSAAVGAELSAETLREVAGRAGGLPLFVEELTRDALVAERPEGGPIPAALRDVIAFRLDRLGTARDVARIAAALGDEVEHEELAAVAALDEADLAADVDRLLAAEVLVRKDVFGAAGYLFQDALLREAAGVSLLAEDRERLRRRRAAWAEARSSAPSVVGQAPPASGSAGGACPTRAKPPGSKPPG